MPFWSSSRRDRTRDTESLQPCMASEVQGARRYAENCAGIMLAVAFDDQQKDAGCVRHRKEERKEIFGGFVVHTLSPGNPKIGLCLEKGHSVKKKGKEGEKMQNW